MVLKKVCLGVWAVTSLTSVAYAALAIVSFVNLRTATEWFQINNRLDKQSFKDSLLASCLLGAVIALFFLVSSIWVFIRYRSADMKMAYGFVTGCALHTAWFMLLSSIVLQNRENLMQLLHDVQLWPLSNVQIYQATFYLGYILIGCYLLTFISMLVGLRFLDGTVSAPGPPATKAQSFRTGTPHLVASAH